MRKEKILKTRQLVSSYCTQLANKITEHKKNSEMKHIQEKINQIALFISKARGIAISGKNSFKNEQGNEVTYYEIKDWQVEQPWRVLNQLKALLRVLSFINKKDTVGEEEIAMIRPVVLSTMPVDRAEVLGKLIVECGLSSTELSRALGKSTKTIQRTMKELEALKIVDCYKASNSNASGQAPWLYYIIPEFASTLNAPVPSQESMSRSRRMLSESESASDKVWNELDN